MKQNKVFSLFCMAADSQLIQFFRYVFVGGAAFTADASALFILKMLGLNYLVAAAFSFVVGLIVNYLLSKSIVFIQDSKYTGHWGEFLVYGLIGLAGLALTELFMFLFTDFIGLYFMLSKLIAAALVLIWNFAARKLILYR
jgi:putative flippase GtrA